MAGSPDTDRVGALMREAARQFVLPRFRALETHEILTKSGDNDLVTVADRESEAWLTDELAALLPGSVVVGEEAVFADATVIDRLAGAAPTWVIDPVDGTWNFAHGVERFAMMVALVEAGTVSHGWILEPASDRLAVGVRGGGVTLDGAPVRLGEGSPASRPDGRHTGVAVRRMMERAKTRDDLFGALRGSSSAGCEYLLQLAGEADFSAYNRLLPWDHAAGAFLVAEAGGVARLLDGTVYSPLVHKGDYLSARSESVWREVRDVLAEA
ncbi:MAG: inositol monophosphatase [Alphaproteobacteria bacterium]